MLRIESLKKAIEGRSIDEQIKLVEDATWMLSMKDNWSNDDSNYDNELNALLKDLKLKKKEGCN